MDDKNIPVPPVNKALTDQANMAKESLFAFQGRDIRSGKKEEVPAPSTESPKMKTIVVPKPPVIATAPTTAHTMPIPPAPSTLIVRKISTAPAPNAPTYAGDENLKPMRTYEGDVAEILAHDRTSTASIAIAESRKKTGEEIIGGSDKPSNAGKKTIIAVISLILIIVGVVGAYYLYSISPLAPTQRSISTVEPTPSLITPDAEVTIPIDGMGPNAIIAAVRNEMAKSQAVNSIKEIILVQTKNGQHFRLSEPDMANIVNPDAPDILLRTLTGDWILGVYADGNGTRTVFIIATVDYFQNAFAGMLQWESTMADDLKQYLYANTPADIALGTSTASTSSAVNRPVILRGSFVDRIIDNKDVREFVTSNGNALFLYSFIDNTHLAITGSEATLSAILGRLEQQAFVR